jgi:uncharacterized membrane-anchored protein
MFWVIKIFATTLGDTLTKPHEQGGLNLSRIISSLVIAAVMVVLIIVTSKGLGRSPDSSNHARA